MTLEIEIKKLNEFAAQILEALDALAKTSRLALPTFGELLETGIKLEADLASLAALTDQPVGELRLKFMEWVSERPFSHREAMERVKACAAHGLPLPWEETTDEQ